MDDYIKRDYLLAEIRVARNQAQLSKTSAAKLEKLARLIPAADVAEVRHGRWMVTDAFPHRVYCSECYATYVPNSNWQIWQDAFGEGGLPRDYCPNYNARMDGGSDDGKTIR